MDIDRINNFESRKSYTDLYKVVDALQRTEPSQQLGILGLMLQTMCRHYNVDPKLVLTVAGRALDNAAQFPTETHRAFAQYVRANMGRDILR